MLSGMEWCDLFRDVERGEENTRGLVISSDCKGDVMAK